MNLKGRLAKIERQTTPVDKVHFIGWADCKWSKSEGIERKIGESQEEFFTRVKLHTSKKWIWCY